MLEIKGLVKQYGDKMALSGVDLTVDEKGIFGILGAEGNGKTALARIIAGCEDATSGEVKINGTAMSRKAVMLKRKVRLVPTHLCVDASMNAFEYLNFVGDALEVEPDKRYRQIKEAIELVGLESAQNTVFARLTSAEQLRLSIAAALIGNPDCIVIDDALSAVEGAQLSEMCELISMLGQIKFIILFSHDPATVRGLCESVAIMSGGKIVLSGKITDIEQKLNSTHELYITVRGEEDKILEAIGTLECVVSAKVTAKDANDVHSISVEHYPDDKIKDEIFAALSAVNAPMLSFRTVVLTLDDAFYSISRPQEKQEMQSAKKIFGRRKNK